ncbi:hypothetical protein E2562_002246 [Oryza meyeriana var. granulata]|uniref:HIT-type domain-containing protein n=1 Tax=Oryza meyeriana var. granulata TaxID=110450 RepID=A0A6G1BIJ3_9ORYZ|nr:hypothetical protein E2562_002246 [Oryza meyeriana var. granulata]
MAGGSCDVCKEAPSKYKCPACRTPYCSVPCFKNHKDNFCQKTIPQEEVSNSSLQAEQGALGHWKEEQIVLMTRIKSHLYWNPMRSEMLSKILSCRKCYLRLMALQNQKRFLTLLAHNNEHHLSGGTIRQKSALIGANDSM